MKKNDPQGQPLLELQHLEKIFGTGKNRTLAVRDVSFSLKKGESTALVGESGCGKSTVARLITRQIPSSKGRIFLNGQDITKSTPAQTKEVYRQVQMVFQDPYSVFSPRMQVGTFLEEAQVYFGLRNRKEANAQARKLLAMVELPEEMMDRLPHQLSGGQLQRAVIARSLSVHPDLLILDEATSALDVSVQMQILKLLISLKKEFNLTYLIIGHDLAVVRSIADRILVMYAGKIVEELESEKLREACHPYTRRLLDSVFSVRGNNNQIVLETMGLENAEVPENGCPYCPRCPYASDKCRNEMPDMHRISEKHQVSCWDPVLQPKPGV